MRFPHLWLLACALLLVACAAPRTSGLAETTLPLHRAWVDGR